MPNKSPAFQFYPADYLADENVDAMTLMQQGAYMRLICHAWRGTTVGRLLNDPQRLSTLAHMTLSEWDENKGPILRAFRIDDDGYITQKRLVIEWEKQQVRWLQTVAAGKRSGEARRERPFNDRSTTVERTANPSSSSSSSSSTSVCNNPPTSGGEAPTKNAKPRRTATGAHAELAEHYVQVWQARYHASYPFTKLDGVKTAQLLKACGGCLEDAKAVIDRYIADDGKFYRGHPLALLTSATQLPRFIARDAGETKLDRMMDETLKGYNDDGTRKQNYDQVA